MRDIEGLVELEVLTRKQEENKKLIERFPFLEDSDSGYNYEYTWLDDMPIGWRKAFGEQMCEEIMQELVKNDAVYEYEILQIKEKFGFLHWYDNCCVSSVNKIIDKYEEISERTCINCGKPATKISTGWISPYCDECADMLSDRVKFVDINKENSIV